MALVPNFRASFIAETAWAAAAAAAEVSSSSGEDPGPSGSDGLEVRMSQQHQQHQQQPLRRMASAAAGAAGAFPPNKGFCKPLLLPQLDLATLASSQGSGRDDPPLSESVLKRNKLALFEKQCSKVCEGLYVSGEAVAKSRAALREHGITHVVNCVGALYPEYWRADGVAYKTLWLQGEQ